jgi:hypothetical protein
LLILNNKETPQNWSQNKKAARLNDEAQACNAYFVGAVLPNWFKNVKVRAMFSDLKQSVVISITGTVNSFLEQSRPSLFLRLVKAGRPIVLLNLPWRLLQLFFAPLNQLHYDMQITTAAHLEKSLTENLTVMGEIAGRGSKEIASQTNAQRRMVEGNSPTMKAKDSPSRASPSFAAYVVEVALPVLRTSSGLNLDKKVMLVVFCAIQKELYLRLFSKLRSNGWSQNELPALCTIDSPHGHEADLVASGINNAREGFLSKPQRMCVTAGRAKQQMLWIIGPFWSYIYRSRTGFASKACLCRHPHTSGA